MHPTTNAGAGVTGEGTALPVVGKTPSAREDYAMSGTGGYGGRDHERKRDLDQAMYVGLARTRRQMLGDHGDELLDKVEVERRLVVETTRAFNRAVAEARAVDFTWEQITQRVPGLVRTFGPQAAERLFEMVAVVGSRVGERYAPWLCGECDGLVRDYGPYGGHPVDTEPGHQGDCERQTTAACAYEAGLEADGQRATDIRQTVPHDGSKSAPPAEAIGPEGPGLGLMREFEETEEMFRLSGVPHWVI